MVELVSSRILSLIVARAGSRGLPNKNIMMLNGKQVFEYTVDYSNVLSRIYPNHTVISTNSQIIIDYCKKNGIDYIDRDNALATDTTRIEDVIYDAYKKLNGNYKYISLLYSDMPTRYIQEFINAYSFLEGNDDYDCAMSFMDVKRHPEYMFIKDNDILPRNETIQYRRQDLKKYIIHNGHTILFRPKHFMKFMESGKDVEYLYESFGRKIKPILTGELIISIDNKYDFKLAESIIRSLDCNG